MKVGKIIDMEWRFKATECSSLESLRQRVPIPSSLEILRLACIACVIVMNFLTFICHILPRELYKIYNGFFPVRMISGPSLICPVNKRGAINF